MSLPILWGIACILSFKAWIAFTLFRNVSVVASVELREEWADDDWGRNVQTDAN